MGWVWVEGKPVWMGVGLEEEGIIMTVDEHVEFERTATLEAYHTGKVTEVYASTTIPYSRKRAEGQEHLRG